MSHNTASKLIKARIQDQITIKELQRQINVINSDVSKLVQITKMVLKELLSNCESDKMKENIKAAYHQLQNPNLLKSSSEDEVKPQLKLEMSQKERDHQEELAKRDKEIEQLKLQLQSEESKSLEPREEVHGREKHIKQLKNFSGHILKIKDEKINDLRKELTLLKSENLQQDIQIEKLSEELEELKKVHRNPLEIDKSPAGKFDLQQSKDQRTKQQCEISVEADEIPEYLNSEAKAQVEETEEIKAILLTNSKLVAELHDLNQLYQDSLKAKNVLIAEHDILLNVTFKKVEEERMRLEEEVGHLSDAQEQVKHLRKVIEDLNGEIKNLQDQLKVLKTEVSTTKALNKKFEKETAVFSTTNPFKQDVKERTETGENFWHRELIEKIQFLEKELVKKEEIIEQLGALSRVMPSKLSNSLSSEC